MHLSNPAGKPLRLVIIGSGIAGHSACRAALETSADAEIVMISRDTSLLYSPCVLPYYIAGEVPRELVFLPQEFEATERVKVMAGVEVLGMDWARKLLLHKDGSVPYDRLILALGGHSVVLPISGINLPGIFHCKTLEDADALRAWPGERAVVVGSGPIGVEVAAALNMRGMKVTVIELLDRLLPVILDASSAAIVADTLREAGIEIRLGERVQGIRGNDRVEAVDTDKGTIPADLVVLAAGIRPAVEVARKAGLEIGPTGGIVTDNYLRTGDPAIWACGDCVQSFDILTGLPALTMLWPNAILQGRHAGINAAGGEKSYPGSSTAVTVNLFETFVFSFGATFRANAGYTVREKTSRKGHIRIVAKEGRLVGVQIVGDDSWAGITAALTNPDIVAALKVKPGREDLFRQTPQVRRLMKLAGDMVG